MPASPFGLAYGLGVAANAIPTQMNERQNMDLQTQMRQLQLSQLRRQEEQEKGLQQAALNVPTEMESKAALSAENLPQGLDTTPASPEVQASARGLNLPTPGTIPNAPTPQQMASVQRPLVMRQQAKVYSTPYQAAAHRYGAMADYLFKQGMVEPAMRLQAQAGQASQMHMEKTGQDAARLLGMGSKEAIPLLQSLGVDATDVGKDKDGTAWIKDTQGNFLPIDYGDLAALASGGAKLGDVFAKMNMADSRLYASQYSAQKRAEAAAAATAQREKAAAEANKTKKEAEAAKAANYAARTAAMVSNAQFRKSSTPADIQKVQARKKNLQDLDPSLSDPEAEDQAWKFVKSSANTKDVPLAVARESVKRIETNNNGRPPKPGSPQYAEWSQAHDLVIKAMTPQPKAAPKVAPPATGGDIPTPASKAEYDALPPNTKYMKDGKVFIKG